MRSAGVPATRALVAAAVLALAASACSSAAAPSATGAAGGSGAGSGSTAPGGMSAASTRPGTWTTVHVPATAVATGERTVLVYTPGVAHPDQLPVVYLLHGEPGQPSDLCDAGVGSALDAVFRSGVAPFVVACPDGNDDDVDDTEWADSADGRSQVETFVIGALITAVEGADRRPRGLRAIAGFSMGGYGAAMLALRHPDLYSQVATLAGYFTIDDPDQVFGGRPSTQAAYNPTDLVGVASQLRWLLIQAAGDDLPLTAHASAAYASLLEAHGARVDLRTTSGGHTGSWARAQLPAVATFFAAGWARS